MVTDIIDKDEPLRNKLRTLGVEILSDITSSPRETIGSICGKISKIMSFLDIASTINIISEMNCNILRKEFSELNQSIIESTGKAGLINRQINLSEFFEMSSGEETYSHSTSPLLRGRGTFKGHTSIGVQKGSTLLKAIKDMSNKNSLAPYEAAGFRSGFALLKKQRRDEINNLIQKKGGNATITDIRSGAYGSLISCSEKTLQRELISMVKDGVLKKMGEKRWSRYFLK
jgi:DNA-binding HxlR family transcriptional regulator